MITFRGEFKDINNRPYRIDIVKQDSNRDEIVPIVLADHPFETSYVGNEENVYEPLLTSEAVIRIITKEPLYELYSEDPLDSKVIFYDMSTRNVKWCGYIEPYSYDQEWVSDNDLLEVNCLDCLGICKYIEFNDSVIGTNVDSFESIIFDILSHVRNEVEKVYMHNGLQLTYNSFGDESIILPELFVSKRNFYDEDGKPMTSKDVLEEICKFLTCTLVQYDNSFIFLDRDGLGNNSISYCSKTFLETYGPWKFDDHPNALKYSLYPDVYSGEDSTRSILPSYNKFTVKSDLYPVEKAFPDLNKDLINQHAPGFVETVDTNSHRNYFQFYKSPYVTCEYYPILSNGNVQWQYEKYLNDVSYSDLKNYVGGTLLAHKCYKRDSNFKEPTELSLDKMLLLHVHDKFPGANVDEDGCRRLITISYDDTNFFAGEDTYLVISGDAVFLDDVDDGVDEMILDTEHHRKKDNFHAERLYLEIEIYVAGKYFNGTGWQKKQTSFRLPFENIDGKTDHFIGTAIPIKNNITWSDYLKNKGYAIMMPKDIVSGMVQVSFFAPQQRIDDSYRLNSIWIKNFKVEFQVPNRDESTLVQDEEKKTDTEYTNTDSTSAGTIREMDELSFKITTDDGKSVNYSSVMRKYGSAYDFVDKLYYIGFDLGNPIGNRQEELMIHKLYQQYKTPTNVLNLDLKHNFLVRNWDTLEVSPILKLTAADLSGKRDWLYLFNSGTTDWAYNRTKACYVEFKKVRDKL